MGLLANVLAHGKSKYTPTQEAAFLMCLLMPITYSVPFNTPTLTYTPLFFTQIHARSTLPVVGFDCVFVFFTPVCHRPHRPLSIKTSPTPSLSPLPLTPSHLTPPYKHTSTTHNHTPSSRQAHGERRLHFLLLLLVFASFGLIIYR